MRIFYSLLFPLVAAAGCYAPDVTSGGFACNSSLNDVQCPDGYSCQVGACAHTLSDALKAQGADGCCVKATGDTQDLPMVNIPKSGPPYSGAHTDPGLKTAADCPDSGLEPNDGPLQALGFLPTPDAPTSKIIKLSICPEGNSPATGRHDVDFFKVDNTPGASSLTLMAEIFYDVSQGDLDVGIFTWDGHSLSSLSVDGTAATNGCAAAAISNGVYYVVVAGANNVDVNKYELLIRSFAKPQTCPNP
jgi:hypothetical protein